jgi:hypothetical protein
MTKSQQKDDMVNAFVASIPTMQTDIALLKKDTKFLTDAARAQSDKSDAIIERLDKMSVVTPEQLDNYKKDVDARFKTIESYINSTKPGVAFSNALVSRWTTFLVLLLLTAAVIALVGHFIPVGK